MKPHRAGQNHRSKKPSTQAKPKPERTVTLVIFGANTECAFDPDEEYGLEENVQFPESAFNRARNAAKEFGLTFAKFLEEATNEKISREITRRSSAAVSTAIAWEGGAQ